MTKADAGGRDISWLMWFKAVQLTRWNQCLLMFIEALGRELFEKKAVDPWSAKQTS